MPDGDEYQEIIPYRGGYLLFKEDSVWWMVPVAEKIPWYTKLWRKIWN